MTPRPEPVSRLARLGEHAKALTAVCTFVALLSGAIGAAAAHVVTPTKDRVLRAEMAAGDLALARRVDGHTRELARIDTALGSMRREQQLTAYLQCVFARRIDPTLAPPECAPVITAWRSR